MDNFNPQFPNLDKPELNMNQFNMLPVLVKM